MQSIKLYTTPFCGFCHAAKRLLTQKGTTFTEIDVSRSAEMRQEMLAQSDGGYTVPQIFIGAAHIGGCDELYALERAGKLDPMLAG